MMWLGNVACMELGKYVEFKCEEKLLVGRPNRFRIILKWLLKE
jgi:hypothetical protein